MKTTTIRNNELKAVINHTGAELASLYKGDKNVIWEINTDFWNKTSPVLFPVVGMLKELSYTYDDVVYHLPRHGFAREYEFKIIDQSESSVVFSLKYSEDTLKIYPFRFELQIGYRIADDRLIVSYNIINHSSEKMYYSIGAHPAFAIDGKFEEYSLVFDKNDTLTTYKLENELFSGNTETIALQDGQLKLDYKLFEKDAIVLKNNFTSSLILVKGEVPQVKVNFSDFPYLGIWTKKDAPFICIEPWLGIADNVSATGKLDEKEGIQVLEGNQHKNVEWTIEVF